MSRALRLDVPRRRPRVPAHGSLHVEVLACDSLHVEVLACEWPYVEVLACDSPHIEVPGGFNLDMGRVAGAGWTRKERGTVGTLLRQDLGAGVRERPSSRGEREDRGAGSLLAVGLIGATLCFALAVVPLGGVLAARQRAAGAADAAALAAADVAVGLRAGEPCPSAESAARANAAAMTACVVDGAIVTVEVAVAFGVVPVTAAATAGPPPEEGDP